MEKGLKNLNQAFRSAQKKANDSGISISDQDDADHVSEPHMGESHYVQYPNYAQQPRRVNSIQSILQQPAMMAYHGQQPY